MTQAMTAGEFRVVREGLGLTRAWLADDMGVQERAVARWEDGERPIPERRAAWLRNLAAEADDQVAELLDQIGDGDVFVLDGDATGMPPSWTRAIAWRLMLARPGLRVVDRMDDE